MMQVHLLMAIVTGAAYGQVGGEKPAVQPVSAESAPFGSNDPDGTWQLAWRDEFDGDRLDASKWLATEASLMNNHELQYYTPDAVTVGGGSLSIRAERRPLGGREYTSGLIDTRDAFLMAFGRFECRAKLPRGQGLWPAIWMLPDSGTWPPEIDIMENLGNEPRRIHTTLHWGPPWPENKKTTAYEDGPDYSADFHVFSVEWAPERLEWFIDGKRVFACDENIPQEPFYLILNLAVGGDWGGNPDGTSVFPQTLTVDWIRAYQRQDPARAVLRADAGHGRVVPEPRRWTFKPGESVTLHAEADIGYEFRGWAGDAEGDRAELKLDMSKNRHVIAKFEAVAEGPRLLSLGRPVRASSSEGYGMEPERAVDASLWTRWSSAFADPQWLEVDLGSSFSIEAVRVAWLPAYARAYSVEVSEDRGTWTPIHAEDDGHGEVETISGLSGRGRFVRLVGKSRNGTHGYSLYSFEVFGR